ncbi:DUF6320 domain-containing protein [Peribacillus sp. NPDC058002]|uniref:DUF6320 domain-containing protein n=1 Tax=Peribacillus sp. NPDC058002 TaxID=3346301 RepID=UPI0036DD5988
MKYCHKCEMNIAVGLGSCPLCGHALKQIGSEKYDPYYQEKIKAKAQLSLKRIMLFLILIINSHFIVGGIYQDFDWERIAVIFFLTVYVYMSLFLGLRIKRSIGPNLLLQVMVVSIIAITFDSISGFSGWSIQVFLPAAIMTGTSILTLLIILKPKLFSELIRYQLFFGFMGLLMYVQIYLDILPFVPILIILTHYILITCIGLFIFTGRRLRLTNIWTSVLCVRFKWGQLLLALAIMALRYKGTLVGNSFLSIYKLKVPLCLNLTGHHSFDN